MQRNGQLQQIVHQLQTYEYSLTLVSKEVDTYCSVVHHTWPATLPVVALR